MMTELKDIAVIVDDGDPLADAVLANIALRLADHYGARLTVFEQGKAFAPLNREDEEGDCGFVDLCGVGERLHSDIPAMAKLFRWAEEDGIWFDKADARTLLERLRYVDLVIMGLPAAPDMGEIILRTGRPTLIVPRRFAERRAADRSMGRRILVAWNNSAACARALYDAIPFLQRAEEVALLHIVDGRNRANAEQTMAALTERLGRHGIETRTDVATVGDRSVSRIVLDHIDDLRADLLVMGAFGRPWLAERLTGSISESLFHNVAIPIFTSS